MDLPAHIAATTVAVCVFGAFAWAIRFHFAAAKMPVAMQMLSLLGLTTFVIFLWQLWASPAGMLSFSAGVVLEGVALAIFVAAVRQTTVRQLPIAFENAVPQFLLRGGIYAYVRHPFYSAYMCFWIGCGLEARSLYYWLCFSLLVVIYFRTAWFEEKSFANSPFAADYAEYQKSTGMFIPKFRSLRRL